MTCGDVFDNEVVFAVKTLDLIIAVFCTCLFLGFGYLLYGVLTYTVAAVCKGCCKISACAVFIYKRICELTAADFDVCFFDCV